MLSVAAFIVILDVLKYGFGTDPVKSTSKKSDVKKKKTRVKKKKPSVAIRFIYVDNPSAPASEQTNSAVERY